jgi:L-threonylcarbamoyladenylate synthase
MHTVSRADISAAADALRSGQRIFDGKRRPAGKSLVLIGSRKKDYAQMLTFTDAARTLADAFWPGDLALRPPWRDPADEARYRLSARPRS